MKYLILIIANLFILFDTITAQTQQGFVKTIGRPDKLGVPLENVTVQMVGMVNPAISSATGEFHLSAYNKKDGDAIKLWQKGTGTFCPFVNSYLKSATNCFGY